MTRDEVRHLLVDTIREILKQDGHEAPSIGDDTRPLQDLVGFDSLSCVEVEVALSERLPGAVEGIFRLNNGSKAKSLRIQQLVDDLCELLGIEEASTNGRP